MFLKGTIVSFICLVWWIIHDHREQRRNMGPSPHRSIGETDQQVKPNPVLEEWKETCKRSENLMEEFSRCVHDGNDADVESPYENNDGFYSF